MPFTLEPADEQSWMRPPCQDTDHNPPSAVCIPLGMRMRHICPSCGNETIVYPPTPTQIISGGQQS